MILPSLPLDDARRLLGDMIRVRVMEERCAELYGEQKIRGFLHLYIGEEAVATGVISLLQPDEAVLATYREHGHALLKGIPADRIMAEMFGKASGCSGGRGGSMHLFDAERRFYGGNAIVGGHLPLAAGLALADSLQGHHRATVCFFGEGAIAEGEFHEAMNLAAKAMSYEVPAWVVDGMDVVAVRDAASRALEVVRGGGGPVFLELQTYRFRAHSMFDPDLYRSKEEVERWRSRDPIDLFGAALEQQGLLTADDIEELWDVARLEIDQAVQFAEDAALEPVETLTSFVYRREVSR